MTARSFGCIRITAHPLPLTSRGIGGDAFRISRTRLFPAESTLTHADPIPMLIVHGGWSETRLRQTRLWYSCKRTPITRLRCRYRWLYFCHFWGGL